MTTWTGTVPTIAAGDTTSVPTNLATYRDILKAVSEAWTPFTPTPTNWAFGNGSMTARYAKVGKFVMVRYYFQAGTTTTYTASATQLTIPTAAHASGLQLIPGRAVIGGSNVLMCATIGGGASVLSLEVPINLTNNFSLTSMSSASLNPGTTGWILLEGMYEAA